VIFRIELSPEISLCYSENWVCTVCKMLHYFGFEKSEPQCVMCEFDKATRDQIMIAGWNLSRSAAQIVASRVARARLGS